MKTGKHTETEKFLAYLPPETMQKLRDAAEKNYRTVNGQLRWILDRYFSGQDKPSNEAA
jgi:hypothetical protein